MDDSSSQWGRLYVNRRCCGAATCRNLAPELLGEVPSEASKGTEGPPVLPDSYAPGAFTGVLRQPRTREEFLRARTAAAACTFGALELERPKALEPQDKLEAPWSQWPLRLEDNVWAMGHPSPKNGGAQTYFIERPEGGVLVDLPKPSEAVWSWLEAHGGVRWLVVTHRDHSQHFEEFVARFPDCRCVMGAGDVNDKGNRYFADTTGVQVKMGSDPRPMRLDGTPLPEEELASTELVVLPQPGHTLGTLCLLYRGRFLFTGDHLCYSRRQGHLTAHRLQCWHDWEMQCDSVQRLVEQAEQGRLRFTWLLPGHGDWLHLEGEGDVATSAATLRKGLEWMRQQPPGKVPLMRFLFFMGGRLEPKGRIARFVRAVGGEAADACLLPESVRPYLSDYDAARTRSALRRFYALGALTLVTASGMAWLGVRLVGSLLSP